MGANFCPGGTTGKFISECIDDCFVNNHDSWLSFLLSLVVPLREADDDIT